MTEPTQPDRAAFPPGPSASRGRRRFLGAGVTSTPALMLLASQPALGATCFTPSRSLSANTSVSQQGKYGTCTGISAGNYKTQTNPTSPANNWPIEPTTGFHPLFSGKRFLVNTSPTKQRSLTLLEVLALPNVPAGLSSAPNDPQRLAFHVIGAYLNILNGRVPSMVLTEGQLKTIWSVLSEGRTYEITAGVRWGPGQFVDYLKNSGIA